MRRKYKRDRVRKMEEKELRVLRKKLLKTRSKTMEEYWRARNHLEDTDESLNKIGRLQERVNYWIGKQKAQKCPAHIYHAKAGAQCAVSFDYAMSMWYLYNRYCSQCTLGKKEAMKQATFNRVFNNPRGNTI